MADNEASQDNSAARFVTAAVLEQTRASGGVATGPLHEGERPQWAAFLIRQFNEAEKRACPHLHGEEMPALWFAMLSDRLACFDCHDALVSELERRLGHPLKDEPSQCSACGQPGPVRGVSLAAGRVLLRGMICSECEGQGASDRVNGNVEATSGDPEIPGALRSLGLPGIRIDPEALSATEDRGDFDDLAAQMLARAGRLAERLIESVSRATNARGAGLDLDEAVIGGLLIRTAKLTRGVFDAFGSESEAHGPLGRCLAETAITLRWLVHKDDTAVYQRFRADSFARWRKLLPAPEEDPGSPVLGLTRQTVERELQAAGLTWDDVPAKPNSWGPDLRQRFEAVGESGMYTTLFVSHSSYVHPSWHEIRALHLRSDATGTHLDYTYAGMTPIAAIVLARLVADACADAAKVLPHDLDTAAYEEAALLTGDAAHRLSLLFYDFAARGGLHEDITRHA